MWSVQLLLLTPHTLLLTGLNMRHKVKHVHFVGRGGAAMSREQGPAAFGATGCDRPRVAPAADSVMLIDRDRQ